MTLKIWIFVTIFSHLSQLLPFYGTVCIMTILSWSFKSYTQSELRYKLSCQWVRTDSTAIFKFYMYTKNLIFFFIILISIILSCRFFKFLIAIPIRSTPSYFTILNLKKALYSSPEAVIGSLNHNPNRIGWILKLHSQKKNWLWNLQCRHSQNKIWLWSLQCRHSQKKNLAVDFSVSVHFGCGHIKSKNGCGICTDSCECLYEFDLLIW